MSAALDWLLAHSPHVEDSVPDHKQIPLEPYPNGRYTIRRQAAYDPADGGLVHPHTIAEMKDLDRIEAAAIKASRGNPPD